MRILRLVVIVSLNLLPLSVAYGQKPEISARLASLQKPRAAAAPHARRNWLISTSVMFGSSFVEAHAAAYGSAQCRAENLATYGNLSHFGGLDGGLYHPYRHDLKITLPLDAGVSLVSWVLHKKHHDTLAVLLPVSSASAQVSLAGMKYSAGCF